MKKSIKRIAALAMALTIAGAGTSVSGVFSANVLTAEAVTVSGNSVSAGPVMKRAEFVREIYTMSGSQKATYKEVFTDVPNHAWFTTPIMWAYDKKIVSGYPGAKFGVFDNITIEQTAQILFNHAKYAKRDFTYTQGAADRYTQSGWARNTHAVDWAVTHNILTRDVVYNNYDVTRPSTTQICFEMIKRYRKNVLIK